MSSHAGKERCVEHRFVESNGLSMHVAEAGVGPLVVLCHGFPESWYSWRHQLPALADAGYRAVAPDMRGYGLTDRPTAIDQYTIFHLVGDVLGVIDALGEETAVVVGHDWGAVVAWHAALLRPDRVRGVVGMSVPFRRRGPMRPTQVMPATPDTVFYQRYFQDPGVAEADLERDPCTSLRTLLVGLSGDAPGAGRRGSPPPEMVRRGGGFLDGFEPARGALPRWLTEADVELHAGQLARTGFHGGLAWYRNMDRNWELLAPYAGACVTVPALYVAGDRDLVVRFPGVDEAISSLKDTVPRLAGRLVLEGCGHWTQQERPGEVNAALRVFLSALGPPTTEARGAEV